MNNNVIRLCYRKIIDSTSSKPWDKLVFDDSYTEYRIQVQNFNLPDVHLSYTDLLQQHPDLIRINHMLSGAIIGYLDLLNNVMPDVLNTLGRRFLRYNEFKVELINSHLDNKERHRISITFYSEPVCLLNIIGNNLLLADKAQQGDEILTDLLPLTPYISIYSVQNKKDTPAHGTNTSHHIFSR